MRVVGHLRELNSDAADYLLQIHKELESTGHSTPEEVFQCGETIRAMILDYGSGHGVSEDILKWWRQLRIFLPTLGENQRLTTANGLYWSPS